MSLQALGEAIDHLFEEADRYSDGESVVAAHRLLNRFEAFLVKVTAGLDASGEWAAVGARNCASYVATEAHLPAAAVRRRLSLSRSLCHLPVTEEAFSSGRISTAHVQLIATTRNERSEKHLERDEPLLVDAAETLRFGQFARLVSYWSQQADPDGTDERAEARRAARDVRLEESYGGTYLGKMTLDPVSGAIVKGELDRIEKELFEADWGEAKRRLGREPALSELARRAGQRRADALVEMATRSATAPPEQRRPRPLFSVLVDFETLSGRILELKNGTVLAPSDLTGWLTEAMLERALLTPQGRVEVSRTSRLFTGATRRAIELRDRRCTHPYCDEPISRCEVDHIVPYAEGGLTTQENGRLLCGFHNRLRSRRPRPPDDPDS
jgi:hypothetical protein